MLHEADTLPGWSVVYSFDQTEGKGRRGRVWSSRPGDTLAMSVLVPGLPAGLSGTWVSLLAGCSVVRVLKDLGLGVAQMKWPNDILVGSQKLSGTLVEQSIDGSLIVGIGINVFSSGDRLPHPDATSLVIEGLDIAKPVDSLVGPVRGSLRHLIEEGLALDPQGCVRFWSVQVENTLGTIGKRISAEGDGGGLREGTAEGLGPSGELRVRADNGDSFAVHAGDVFYIPRS